MTAGQRALKNINRKTVQQRWWGLTEQQRMEAEISAWLGAAFVLLMLVGVTYGGA